ncbi:MAG: 30S ribosome-binding factor RbfA, partial [Planctomycetes bacterium]|nr:30S ribosome-binding factor RbfA [Planctomycetota bacterium]
MASHRLEKVARSIQATVGDVIQSQLSDPRIKGMISVTRVDPAPDLRSARVYISILGVDEKQQQLSLRGIEHARGHIQHLLAKRVTFKMCPTLQFFLDESLKKG